MTSSHPVCAACGRAIGAHEARVCVADVDATAAPPSSARLYHLDCWRAAATAGSAAAAPKTSTTGAMAAQRA